MIFPVSNCDCCGEIDDWSALGSNMCFVVAGACPYNCSQRGRCPHVKEPAFRASKPDNYQKTLTFMSSQFLEFTDLEVQRADRVLFSGLSGGVSEQEILFVEGENGSGKSTLLRCLSSLYTPDAGEITWQGEAIRRLGEEYRQQLLYLGHLNGIKANLTALENLKFLCAIDGEFHSTEALEDALGKLGLAGYEDVPSQAMSQGQKRRVALARLLLSRAKIWILDEPFVALDAAAVSLLQEIISRHLESGGICILTTHQETPLTNASVRKIRLGG
jgi:heme exporter protein A